MWQDADLAVTPLSLRRVSASLLPRLLYDIRGSRDDEQPLSRL